jgi:hypothetical protein
VLPWHLLSAVAALLPIVALIALAVRLLRR